MSDLIVVEPAPGLRVEFARWGSDHQPGFRTCSHAEFEVPPSLLSEVPEELLIGALVDGHRYRSPIEDAQLGVAPPGTWPGPESVTEFAPLEDAPTSDGQDDDGDSAAGSYVCGDCGNSYATERGVATHRRQKHPEGA